MKNKLLKYNLTAFVLFIVAAICPAQRPPLAGGYKETSKTDEMVVAAANFAVETQMQKDASLKLVAIKRAARQVVQGSNYEMCLAVTSENKPQEATVVVYQDLQNNFSLTSWISGKCAAGAEDKPKPEDKTPAKKDPPPSKSAAIVFEEHFDNNNAKWPVGADEWGEATLVGGVYKVKGMKGAKIIFQTVAVDQTKNFKIEFTAKWIGGKRDAGYGLIWGFKDVDNQYQFAISATGSFIIVKLKNGKETVLSPWANSDSISAEGANKLSIEKSGSQLIFLINDTVVKKIPFEAFAGDKIGFIVNGSEVDFDDLTVTQLEPE